MSNILFERPVASRFQYDNKKMVDNTNNSFNYLEESSNIRNQFHYENNIVDQNNTFHILKAVSTREEKKVTEEQKKNDYAKKSNASIYNK